MEIKKSFVPEIKDTDLGTGLTSFSSWGRLKQVLEAYFIVRNNERIIGLKANQDGITVYLQNIPKP